MNWLNVSCSAPGAPPQRGFCAAVFALTLVIGCHHGSKNAFTDLIAARGVAGDLRVQFNKAADASNRAVMADTDDASIAFAGEAEDDKKLVKSDVVALEARLHDLGYAAEIKSLEEFGSHFSEYEKIDHGILELAVENTNLKAQRLSFGPAREAADAFRNALVPLVANTPAKDRCQVDALVAKAVVAVREIQVLQAPHIAESDDAAMTRLENEMAALEGTAHDVLNALPGLVDASSPSDVAAAVAAFGRFEDTSKEIIRLSRVNSNVRSLELSLRRKPEVTAACDESVRALEDALSKEAFTATR